MNTRVETYEYLSDEGLYVPGVYLGGVVGRGGSKTVIDARDGERHFALAIPNRVDNIAVRSEKWRRVSSEPAKAAMLADIGLLVPTGYGSRDAFMDGEAIEAMTMDRFSDMPFEVYDSKVGTYENGILPHIDTPEELRAGLAVIGGEIVRLAKHGVSLGFDSVNFAATGDGARLFLYDLEGMDVGYRDSRQIMGKLATLVVWKLDNVLNIETLRRLESNGFDTKARGRLIEYLANCDNLQ